MGRGRCEKRAQEKIKERLRDGGGTRNSMVCGEWDNWSGVKTREMEAWRKLWVAVLRIRGPKGWDWLEDGRSKNK